MDYIQVIKNMIKQNISLINNKSSTNINNIFELLLKSIESYNTLSKSKKIITMTDIKNLDNKKIKGDLFEAFCYLYIKHILKHNEVWLYNNIPNEIKQLLHLTPTDYGIDIVSKHDNKYYAIQCKYKKASEKKQFISWRSLSTFYAIVHTTGPFEKHITMTNVNGCRHIGKKGKKDYSICIGTFKSIKFFDWLNLINQKDEINKDIQEIAFKYDNEFNNIDIVDEDITEENKKQISIDELRNKRLEYYKTL
jgi:hypothetical protein